MNDFDIDDSEDHKQSSSYLLLRLQKQSLSPKRSSSTYAYDTDCGTHGALSKA